MASGAELVQAEVTSVFTPTEQETSDPVYRVCAKGLQSQLNWLQRRGRTELTLVHLEGWGYPIQVRRRSNRELVLKSPSDENQLRVNKRSQPAGCVDERSVTEVQVQDLKRFKMGEPKDDERLKALVRQARNASKEADVVSHRLLASTVDLKVEPVGNEIIKRAAATTGGTQGRLTTSAAQVMGRNPNRARCRFGCDDKLNELEGECESGAFRGTMALKDPLQVRNLEPSQPGGELVWRTVRHTAVLRSQVYTSDMPPIWDFYWLQCPDCPECVPLFSSGRNGGNQTTEGRA